MAERVTKTAKRRDHVREQRARIMGTWRGRLAARVFSWPALSGTVFVLAASAIGLLGKGTLGYSIGQRIDQPIYARVAFQVPNEEQTRSDREAARASTPSYYTLHAPALTFDRIRAELLRVYEAAVNASSFEEYKKTVEGLHWPAEEQAYNRLRTMADEAGRAQFQAAVDQLPLEQEYIVSDLLDEPRDPRSVTGFIRLVLPSEEGQEGIVDIPAAELTRQRNAKALQGSAAGIARRFRVREVASTVEAVVLTVFTEQPTIVFDRERTTEAMRLAAEATPVAMTSYDAGTVFVKPGVVGTAEYDLLRAEHAAYESFLNEGSPEALAARRQMYMERAGLIALVALLSIGLLAYVGWHHHRVFEVRTRTVAFVVLVIGTLLAARLLDLADLPELVVAPCLIAASILAITYPQRLAMGATCIVAVLIATIIDSNVAFLIMLFSGVVVAVFQLDEIRSRTKLIVTGLVTSVAVVLTAAAGWLWLGHSVSFIVRHALLAGASAMLASFVVSGILPLIERLFRVATSLTLLEWRDPTRPLLQRLAREAPGTYNHSLVLGTLAEAACEAIGANGLLAQVGALYHDIGKIPKAQYFTENQTGTVSRHDNLAPTMSLLIIVGHVKDGIEMAKEYRLPRVLHQFIEEHHGTTVVRYFHHVASEKQPRIASGKHDREVPEAEFRYGGPKPRTRESAVLMMCDGVEGAVRALPEPTANRIEGVVEQVVADRLRDGQFDDCDISLKQIRLVRDSLVKSLSSIYHGRVAYPKAGKPDEGGAGGQAEQEPKHAGLTGARAG